MPKSLDRQSAETDDLLFVSSQIAPLAMAKPDPPGAYWQSPSQHRRRAAQLRAKNPTSRAAALTELAARAIEERLRDGEDSKEW
jgi:hypothetical protein